MHLEWVKLSFFPIAQMCTNIYKLLKEFQMQASTEANLLNQNFALRSSLFYV